MTTSFRSASILTLLLLLAGCDDGYSAFTRDGSVQDGGADASEPGPIAESCGVPVDPISESTRSIVIDTAPLGEPAPSLCGQAPVAHRAYVAIDATAGSVWHAHVASTDAAGEPSLALLDTACDSRDCVAESSHCDGASDEHFTFSPNADGRYWLALDEASAAGAHYSLDVIEDHCGDAVDEHGEACDDGNLLDEDGCDRRCRVELSSLRTAETEPNDDRFEANTLLLDGGALTIGGSIAGPGACTYSDTFAVATGAGGLRVRVESTEGACGAASGAQLRLVVTDATGSMLADESFDLGACLEHELADLPAGEVFVALSPPAPADVPLAYRLTVEEL